MKDNLTEIVFILDRSGSMEFLTNDTIGGFNSFIKDQKKLPGEALLTTVLFDDRYEILHNAVNISDVPELTRKQYFARGWTALLDAIGKTLVNVGHRLDLTKEEDKPSKVIVVITTDGLENASHEYTQSLIKSMVDTQRDVYKWEFLFLGANIDSFLVGGSYGINNTSNYSPNDIGTRSVYDTVSNAVKGFRSTGKIEEDWSKEVK